MDSDQKIPLTCACCGKWNRAGEAHLRQQAEKNPIYGTDFSKPISELIEERRKEISLIRGKLEDISAARPVIGESIKEVEGLLTCGLRVLAEIAREMKAHEDYWIALPNNQK